MNSSLVSTVYIYIVQCTKCVVFFQSQECENGRVSLGMTLAILRKREFLQLLLMCFWPTGARC